MEKLDQDMTLREALDNTFDRDARDDLMVLLTTLRSGKLLSANQHVGYEPELSRLLDVQPTTPPWVDRVEQVLMGDQTLLAKAALCDRMADALREVSGETTSLAVQDCLADYQAIQEGVAKPEHARAREPGAPWSVERLVKLCDLLDDALREAVTFTGRGDELAERAFGEYRKMKAEMNARARTREERLAPTGGETAARAERRWKMAAMRSNDGSLPNDFDYRDGFVDGAAYEAAYAAGLLREDGDAEG